MSKCFARGKMAFRPYFIRNVFFGILYFCVIYMFSMIKKSIKWVRELILEMKTKKEYKKILEKNKKFYDYL